MVQGDNDFPCYHPDDCRCDSCRFVEGELEEEDCEKGSDDDE
jgi:hypothetical protein